MYIVQQSFTSVHGRYYYRGQEVSWLWRQLMASTDKKNLVRRSLYVSSYEEEYRQELQERDGETGRGLGSFTGDGESLSCPVGGEWTPDEDIMHFPSQRPRLEQGLREDSMERVTEMLDPDLSSQIAGWEQSPSADDIGDKQELLNNDTYESSRPTSVDSSSVSDTSSSSSSHPASSDW